MASCPFSGLLVIYARLESLDTWASLDMCQQPHHQSQLLLINIGLKKYTTGLNSWVKYSIYTDMSTLILKILNIVDNIVNLCLPLQLHASPSFFSALQPHWPSIWPLKSLWFLLPQGLCIWQSFPKSYVRKVLTSVSRNDSSQPWNKDGWRPSSGLK